MSNIRIYDPFSTRLNRLLEQFFGNVFTGEKENIFQTIECKIDIAEDEDNYFVYADIPGVAKENIKVEINNNQILINAAIKKSNESKNKNLICCERYGNKYYRRFMLDRGIDETNAQAKYTNGVLALTLPKKNDGWSNRCLTIQ